MNNIPNEDIRNKLRDILSGKTNGQVDLIWGPEMTIIPIVKRKWGHYVDHYRSCDCVCKTLYIEPGKAISYQFHNRRSEFWYIQEGKAEITINDYSWNVGQGFTVNIHSGTKHKIKNTGETTLMIHEMQYGYCSEEDIVRLDENLS